MNWIIFLSIFCISQLIGITAHSEADEENESSFGKGKAIEAVEEEGKRFKLGRESLNFLKIESKEIGFELNKDRLNISEANLVTFQDKEGIYIQKGAWFELFHVKTIKRVGEKILVKVAGVSKGDRLVTNQLGILRAAQLQASGALDNVDDD